MKLFFISITVLVFFAMGFFLIRLSRLTGYHEAVASIAECRTNFGSGYGSFLAPLSQCENYLKNKKEGEFFNDTP